MGHKWYKQGGVVLLSRNPPGLSLLSPRCREVFKGGEQALSGS